MKKKSIVLLFLVLFSTNLASALCINCGCNKAYKSCLKKWDEAVEAGGTAIAFNQNPKECKDTQNACHGEGIKLQL